MVKLWLLLGVSLVFDSVFDLNLVQFPQVLNDVALLSVGETLGLNGCFEV